MGSRAGVLKQAAARAGLTVDQWKAKRESGFHWCSGCKFWREESEFQKDKSRASGLQNYCRSCCKIKQIAARYKIPKAMVRELLSIITCPICLRTGVKFEIDHCHISGKVRASICSRCNGALGQFCDDVKLLNRAINYLERHK